MIMITKMKKMIRKGNEDFKRKSSKSQREHWSKRNKTRGVKDDSNWAIARGEERERLRRGEERADWIFERAKHRKDSRYEETRGDWYFERKEHRNSKHKQYSNTHCDKDDNECQNLRKQTFKKEGGRGKPNIKYDDTDEREYSAKNKFNHKMKSEEKQRGERFSKKEKKYNNFRKRNDNYKGETNMRGDDNNNNEENNFDFYHFDEQVQYAERHYSDESGKNRHEKRAKRRFSKTENDKRFVMEADFNQFY